jgi:hypothetical protein
MGRRSPKGCGRGKGLARWALRRITNDRMGSAVIVMLLALSVLLMYVGVYAKVTKNGYHRSHLVAELREARMENMRLRADIQMLSSPDRLAQIATTSGMQTGNQFDYVGERPTVVVAEARQ